MNNKPISERQLRRMIRREFRRAAKGQPVLWRTRPWWRFW